MLIKLKQKKLPKKSQLSIKNEELSESDCVKYLRVLIDNNLTWKKHIAHLKTVKRIGLLAKLMHYAPKSILRNTYNALISPHFDQA